jgi:hypothetical protein
VVDVVNHEFTKILDLVEIFRTISRSTHIPLITPMDLEWKDRETEVRRLANAICSNFTAVYLESQNKKHYSLIGVVGGPGTGKTRLCITALALLRKELQQHHDVYLKSITNSLPQNSGIDPELVLSSLERSLIDNSNTTLYIDMCNRDFIPEYTNVNQQVAALYFSIAAKVTSSSQLAVTKGQIKNFDLELFSSGSVAQYIRSILNVKDTDYITLALNLDEIQTKITSFDLDIVHQNGNKDNILLRQIMIALMIVVTSLAKFKIHVIPLVSGTISPKLLDIFPATIYTTTVITPTPLTMKSTKDIAPDLPESFLCTLGGVPRMIEYLNSVVKEYGGDNLNLIYSNLVQMVYDEYTFRSHLSESTLQMMLRLCLTGKKVNRDYEINGKKLGALEKETVVFFAPTDDPDAFKVLIPLVFVAAYNRRYKFLHDEYFWYRPVMLAHELELFSRNFDMLYNNLLYDIGVRETTFGERYFGAYMSDTLAKRKITIS